MRAWRINVVYIQELYNKLKTDLNLVILSVSASHLASMAPCNCVEQRESQEVLKLLSATYLSRGKGHCLLYKLTQEAEKFVTDETMYL